MRTRNNLSAVVCFVAIVAISLAASFLNAQCRSNLNHLSTQLARFDDPGLIRIREEILSTNINQVLNSIRDQGLSAEQAAIQAEQAAMESQNAQHEDIACIKKSAEDPEKMLRMLQARQSFQLPPRNIVGLCVRAYIAHDYGIVAARESARQIRLCGGVVSSGHGSGNDTRGSNADSFGALLEEAFERGSARGEKAGREAAERIRTDLVLDAIDTWTPPDHYVDSEMSDPGAGANAELEDPFEFERQVELEKEEKGEGDQEEEESSRNACNAQIEFSKVEVNTNPVEATFRYQFSVRHDQDSSCRVGLIVALPQGYSTVAHPAQFTMDVPPEGMVENGEFAVPLTIQQRRNRSFCQDTGGTERRLIDRKTELLRKYGHFEGEIARLEGYRDELAETYSLERFGQIVFGAKAIVDSLNQALPALAKAGEGAMGAVECLSFGAIQYSQTVSLGCGADAEACFETAMGALPDLVFNVMGCSAARILQTLSSAGYGLTMYENLKNIQELTEAKAYTRELLDDVMASLESHRGTFNRLRDDIRITQIGIEKLEEICQNQPKSDLTVTGVNCRCAPTVLRP